MCSPCLGDWGRYRLCSFCLIPDLLSIVVITSSMEWWPLSGSRRLQEPHRGKGFLILLDFFPSPCCCMLFYRKGFKPPWAGIGHYFITTACFEELRYIIYTIYMQHPQSANLLLQQRDITRLCSCPSYAHLWHFLIHFLTPVSVPFNIAISLMLRVFFLFFLKLV